VLEMRPGIHRDGEITVWRFARPNVAARRLTPLRNDPEILVSSGIKALTLLLS
jgi:hypothetical protein